MNKLLLPLLGWFGDPARPPPEGLRRIPGAEDYPGPGVPRPAIPSRPHGIPGRVLPGLFTADRSGGPSPVRGSGSDDRGPHSSCAAVPRPSPRAWKARGTQGILPSLRSQALTLGGSHMPNPSDPTPKETPVSKYPPPVSILTPLPALVTRFGWLRPAWYNHIHSLVRSN